jgi:nicotinamide riboside transporter PnuC
MSNFLTFIQYLCLTIGSIEVVVASEPIFMKHILGVVYNAKFSNIHWKVYVYYQQVCRKLRLLFHVQIAIVT